MSDLPELLTGYDEVKAGLQAVSGLSAGALQIYAAVLVQLAVAALSRRSLGHPLPWLAALGLVIADEWLEHLARAGEVRDIVLAMLIPTLLLVVVRLVPGPGPRGRKRTKQR